MRTCGSFKAAREAAPVGKDGSLKFLRINDAHLIAE